jgi:hypothetical protein
VPSLTALVLSCQVILGTFFVSILGIRRAHQPLLPADGDAVAARPSPAQPGLAPAFADPLPDPEYRIGLGDVPIDVWRLDRAGNKVSGPQDAG